MGGELRRMQMRQQAEIFVKELKTGDFFGEEAILHENHHVSVRSITYCDLLVRASRDLDDVVADFRSLAIAIEKTLEQREDERAMLDKHERARLKKRRSSRRQNSTVVTNSSMLDAAAAAVAAVDGMKKKRRKLWKRQGARGGSCPSSKEEESSLEPSTSMPSSLMTVKEGEAATITVASNTQPKPTYMRAHVQRPGGSAGRPSINSGLFELEQRGSGHLRNSRSSKDRPSFSSALQAAESHAESQPRKLSIYAVPPSAGAAGAAGAAAGGGGGGGGSGLGQREAMMLASLDHRQRGLEASMEKLQDAVSNIEKLLEEHWISSMMPHSA